MHSVLYPATGFFMGHADQSWRVITNSPPGVLPVVSEKGTGPARG